MNEEKPILEFFVTTKSGSVYRARCEEKEFRGTVERISTKKKGEASIVTKLHIGNEDFASGHNYIGIGRCLCLYYGPPKHGNRPVAELVNTIFWGGSTSEIVAMFFNKADAKKCAIQKDLKYHDPRWKAETKKVESRIGNNHPRFVLGTGT